MSEGIKRLKSVSVFLLQALGDSGSEVRSYEGFLCLGVFRSNVPLVSKQLLLWAQSLFFLLFFGLSFSLPLSSSSQPNKEAIFLSLSVSLAADLMLYQPHKLRFFVAVLALLFFSSIVFTSVVHFSIFWLLVL